MTIKKYNLAIVQTHATQFDGPLFKQLSKNPNIELTVYYTKFLGKAPFDKEIGRSPDWDNDVADGYCYKTKKPGFFNACRFIVQIIKGGHNLVIVSGNSAIFRFFLALCLRLNGVSVGLRSDMILLYAQPHSAKSILKNILWPFLFKLYSSGHPTGTLAEEYLLKYGFSRDHIFRFPYTVDNNYIAERCRRYRKHRNRLRKALNIKSDSFVVLGIIKFNEREDPMTLVLGFAGILENYPDAHLVLVGDGTMMDDIRNIISQKNILNVHLPGFVNYRRLPLFYSIADVFVHPPVQESWGVSINEAMVCGLPVIVANTVGSHIDLVKLGETGFVFEAKNSKNLTEYLIKLTDDPILRQKMGNNSRELIKSWNYDYIGESLLKALASVKSKANREIYD